MYGYGVYTHKDGTQYKGQWKNSQRHGKGTLIYPDGTELKDKWINNELVEKE